MVNLISQYVSYNKFSTSHHAFIAAIIYCDEPKNSSQEIVNPIWREAMSKEIKALKDNGTWILAKLPLGKKVIESKWVYKIKYKPNGHINRFKSCMVSKGYTQVERINFLETFVSVAKLVTVRSALAVASKKTKACS